MDYGIKASPDGTAASAVNSDSIAATVEGALAAAMGRHDAAMHQTYMAGSTIGDAMSMPPTGLDPGAGPPGSTDPAGGFYDPPRNY